MKKIILASASKYRKELLERLGIDFQCIPADIDEDSFKSKISDPAELAKVLAYEKAKVVFEKHPDAIVIGSDQLGYIDNQILGKTGSFDGSVKQLKLLSGKEHKLLTAYCVISNIKNVLKLNVTKLKMKNLNDLQIKNYLRKDNPFDCAGSYKLELNGISLFENIETVDHTAIIGLPLIELGLDLEEFGVTVPPEL